MPKEQLKCNICGVIVSSNEVKEHAATALHSSLRSKLESDLDAKRKERYSNDSSVILQWSSSV